MSTTLFQVTIVPKVNEEVFPAKTFSSENSYEHCYNSISHYLNTKCKKNSDDKVYYDVIHTSMNTYWD